MRQHISLSGQFRIVKRNNSGQITFDSGELNNLILDTGLDFFGNQSPDSVFLSYLALGTGNSKPTHSQNRLDNIVAVSYGYEHSKKDDYNEERDGEYFTASRTYKYVFNNLDNVNISELGLVSTYYFSDYTAYTRALIKDADGRPTVITVLPGEVLEVFYTIKQVFHLQDKTFQLNLSDGRGGTRGIVNCVMRLSNVGGSYVNWDFSYGSHVGKKARLEVSSGVVYTYNSQELSNVKGEPKGRFYYVDRCREIAGAYQSGTYKKSSTLLISEYHNLTKIGAILIPSTMGLYQISFADEHGEMLKKSNAQTFSITLEFSWGRDERN